VIARDLSLVGVLFVGGSHSSFIIATLTGDTLKIHFTNLLPAEACNTSVPEMWNQYHGVSTTNLHLHGMHVPDAVNPFKLKIEAGEDSKRSPGRNKLVSSSLSWSKYIAGWWWRAW